MRRLACLVVLAACWTSSSTSPPAPPKPTAPTPDAAVAPVLVDAGPLAASCPASFAAAQQAGVCNTFDQCRYPQGMCTCSAPPWCKGAAPPADYGQHRSWRCMPNTLPGGCPGIAPMTGQACTTPGKQCSYTCGCIAVATCTNGAWKMERGPCVP